MNRVACQYAIVRFMPFVETGEFANVGIVMMSTRARYFGFKLQARRYGRITHFFEGVEARHYTGALRYLGKELDRIQGMLKTHGFDQRLKDGDDDFAQSIFAELVRPRESIVRFSMPRAVLTQNPEAELERLFDYYVQRDFVTKQYTEKVLENNVRGWLQAAHLQHRFKPCAVGDERYRAKFPFVETVAGWPTKAIKPLYLGQDRTEKIIDRGGEWAFRIRQLRQRGRLPRKVMFAVAGPGEHCNGDFKQAYQDAVGFLADTGATVVGDKERERVVEFATES